MFDTPLTLLSVPTCDSYQFRYPCLILPLIISWIYDLVLGLLSVLKSVLLFCFWHGRPVNFFPPHCSWANAQTPNAFTWCKMIRTTTTLLGTQSLQLSNSGPWNKTFGSQIGGGHGASYLLQDSERQSGRLHVFRYLRIASKAGGMNKISRKKKNYCLQNSKHAVSIHFQTNIFWLCH